MRHYIYILFVLFSFRLSAETTIEVCTGLCDYNKIQDAIDYFQDTDDNISEPFIIHVQEGTYYENLVIETSLTLMGTTTDPNINDPRDVIIDGSQYLDHQKGSVITVRPLSGFTSNSDSLVAASEHPQVIIKNFTITGGVGTLMENKRLAHQGSVQARRIGSGMLAYLTIPTLENCIFIHNGSNDNFRSQSGNSGTLSAVDDPDDIIYPNESNIENMRNEYDSNNMGKIAGDILLTGVKFIENEAQEGSSVYIEGFVENEVKFLDCEFDVYSPSQASTPEYWVNGYWDPSYQETTTFTYDNCSALDEIQIDGNTYKGKEAFYEDLNIDPSIGDDLLCGLDSTNTTCKTITKALSIVMPLEGESITLTLSSGTYSGRTGSRPDGEIYPISMIKNVQIIGSGSGINNEGRDESILDAGEGSRVIECNVPMDPTFTALSQIKLTNGDNRMGGGLFLSNCSPRLEDVNIYSNSSFDLDNADDGRTIEEGKGGGIYMNNSSPRLVSVQIDNNYAGSKGSGIYSINNSNPEIIGGNISNNGENPDRIGEITSEGGGIYASGSSPIINNVAISNNQAISGGGIFIVGDENNLTSPNIGDGTSIESNQSQQFGAGLYINNSQPILNDIDIRNNKIMGTNTDKHGAGIYILNDSDENEPLILQNVRIKYNNTNADNNNLSGTGIYIYSNNNYQVNINGGSIVGNGACYDYSLDVEISDCITPLQGGGIFIAGTNTSIGIDDGEPVVIKQNRAGEGGGIYSKDNMVVSLNNVHIKDNQTVSNGRGGGIYSFSDEIFEINNAVITGNHAYDGGGIYGDESNIRMKYVETTNNQVDNRGGGIFNSNSHMELINITISGNLGDEEGGKAIWSDLDGIIEVTNSIIWNGEDEIRLAGDSDIDISYSNIEGGQFYGVYTPPNSESIVNFFSILVDGPYPVFTDTSNADYTLQAGSPCIDSGDPDLDGDGEDYTTDIDDQDPDGSNSDMGANTFFRFDGCMDQSACNYVTDATIDDDSCEFPEENYNCNGDCIAENGYDACSVCGGNEVNVENCCLAEPGDLNYDQWFNILDVVILVNCILDGNCMEIDNWCASDLNGDGLWNVVDIVHLVNCSVAYNCNGRVDDASESKLLKTDNLMYIESDGFIGGVQMTLVHGTDFTIIMNDEVLYSDYLTIGNKTRLLVISPETDELFSFNGDFEILDIIVVNSHEEVAVEYVIISDFSLSKAYPNPFNPSTNIDFSVTVPSDIMIQIFDLQGKLVETLVSGNKTIGKYSLTWQADNYSSGLYLIKMSAFPENNSYTTAFHKTRKLLLIK